MLLSSATASLSCEASPERAIDHPTERKGVFAMKKRLEILYSTAICSGILLLLLGILFAAVLAGHPEEGAALEEQAAADTAKGQNTDGDCCDDAFFHASPPGRPGREGSAWAACNFSSRRS